MAMGSWFIVTSTRSGNPGTTNRSESELRVASTPFSLSSKSAPWCMLRRQSKVKAENPLKVILGTPNFLATVLVNGRQTSEITQLGLGLSSSKSFSMGFSRACTEYRRAAPWPREGSWSSVSQCFGSRPTPSSDGSSSSATVIWTPVDSTARETVPRIRPALTGVVMMVTTTPCWARSLAMSVMGSKWPCAMKGTRTKWSSEAMVEGSLEE
ncbi:unnamed protein product [Linum tenue]|uniref:Uncharacterized protein n=1 Tax=Linum tenue TaxID=586396 RepID=A0AAV0JFA0_9ROSI|nr:unnamed protein product [Linum tenue]